MSVARTVAPSDTFRPWPGVAGAMALARRDGGLRVVTVGFRTRDQPRSVRVAVVLKASQGRCSAAGPSRAHRSLSGPACPERRSEKPARRSKNGGLIGCRLKEW